MLGLGPHASYILVSYGVAAMVLLTLVVWSVLADRRARRDVALLEQRRRGGPQA